MNQQAAPAEVGTEVSAGSNDQQAHVISQQPPQQQQQYGYNNAMVGGIAGQPQPVSLQQIQWMPAPQMTIPGCPRGLEYLAQIDQLLIHQVIELFEGKIYVE